MLERTAGFGQDLQFGYACNGRFLPYNEMPKSEIKAFMEK
jgi:hypothetical protein